MGGELRRDRLGASSASRPPSMSAMITAAEAMKQASDGVHPATRMRLNPMRTMPVIARYSAHDARRWALRSARLGAGASSTPAWSSPSPLPGGAAPLALCRDGEEGRCPFVPSAVLGARGSWGMRNANTGPSCHYRSRPWSSTR
jgi:hypothetical protein